MKVYINNNNNIIKTSDSQFWSCDNCASKFNNGIVFFIAIFLNLENIKVIIIIILK